MLKYCLRKWDDNKDVLKNLLENGTKWNDCKYIDLVKLVVNCVLNEGAESDVNSIVWDSKNITVIDDGKYQGTLLFLIPMDIYQPNEREYLMTYVGYGSCSGCDTLQALQDYREDKLTDSQVKGFMALCKDILTNMIKPYNYGWRFNEEFVPVEVK